MNAQMAIGAILISRVRHVMGGREHGYACSSPPEGADTVMAFEAHGENDGTFQETRIGRPVRGMTYLAAFYSDGGMLKRKGSALVGVTFQAGFFVHLPLTHHGGPSGHAPARGRRAVGIVAITAGHESFIDTMLEGHRELRADIGVAAVAEFGLAFRQQEFRRRGFVDGVTLGASDVITRMDGPMDVRACEALGMTA